MTALQAIGLDGPDSLAVREVPVPPRPGAHAVLIDVRSAGLGFVDTLIARGLYQIRRTPPFTPGLEVAGVVAEPDAAGQFAVGDRVSAFVEIGGCAQRSWAPVERIAPLPERLSFAEGAAMVVNHHTAWCALTLRARVQAGETVLVHGAGGGLGGAAIQVAAALGADVWAVASTPKRRALATACGATRIFGPDEWFDVAREVGGVDVILDPVGGDVLERSVRCLRLHGRLVTAGYASGTIPSVAANRLLLKNTAVLGINWAGLVDADPGLFARTATALDRLGIAPAGVTTYALDDAAQAFRDLEERRVAGKVALAVPRST